MMFNYLENPLKNDRTWTMHKRACTQNWFNSKELDLDWKIYLN